MDSWWTPEPKDLQVEGEEKEYFLELLMRESAPKKGATEEPAAVGNKAGQPVKKGATRKNKPASSRGNRKGSEKTSKGETGVSAGSERKEASAWNEGGPTGSQPGTQMRVVPPDLPGDPGAKHGSSQARAQPEARPQAQVMTTS